MLYALVEGQRQRAARGVPAICPQCHARMMPKCGAIVTHHWAHERDECDPWWEPETEWHRQWKTLVPPEQSEVSRAGHRADIVRQDGTVVELQHSSIDVATIADREHAYRRMAWLFDGTDLDADRFGVRDRGQYTSFRWKHPRKTYGRCQQPVFIDLGDNTVFWLRRLHLDDPPYAGWGYSVPAFAFVRWLRSASNGVSSLTWAEPIAAWRLMRTLTDRGLYLAVEADESRPTGNALIVRPRSLITPADDAAIRQFRDELIALVEYREAIQ